jgi:triphosphatase
MPRLLRHPALRPLRRGRARTVAIAATYFDSPDFRLQRDDVALRVRRVGSRWIQTLKGPQQSGAGAGLTARPEYEWPLPGPGIDASRLATTPWKKLFAKAAGDGGLVPCCTTEFERRTVELAFPDGTVAHLCLDRGEIRAVRDGRARRAPIAEVELELAHGDAASLFRLAVALAKDLPLAVMTETKAERGYALRRGLPRATATPAHAMEVALAADTTTADALAAIARECLHQIAANAPGLMADDDPEWIHQMRVGTRRLRSCLSLVAPFASAELFDPVVTEVKWLATLLGKARDWDVFVTQTLPPLTAWFARDPKAAPGMRRLRERALRRRRIARNEARAAIASPRLQHLLLSGGLLCATPRFGSPTSATRLPPSDSNGLARGFAAKLIARRHRKLAALAATLLHANSDERHAARIAAKRLRYVAEFFAPLFPGKRTGTYLETLASAQDALGRFNDAVTAASLASDLSGPADHAAAGAVRGWVAAQAAALEPHLAKAVRRFNATRPFWPT